MDTCCNLRCLYLRHLRSGAYSCGFVLIRGINLFATDAQISNKVSKTKGFNTCGWGLGAPSRKTCAAFAFKRKTSKASKLDHREIQLEHKQSTEDIMVANLDGNRLIVQLFNQN